MNDFAPQGSEAWFAERLGKVTAFTYRRTDGENHKLGTAPRAQITSQNSPSKD